MRLKSFIHQLLLPGLITLAAVSCSKVESVPAVDQAISFAVGTYARQTKVADVYATDHIDDFTSKAFLHANGASSGTNYFGEDGITIQKTSTTWEPIRTYYWPKAADSYINFISWYDNGGMPSVATETQLNWVNRTIGATDNILFADEAWGYKANTTTFYTSGVPTLFHHALSRIAFTAKASPLTDPDHAATSWSVTVDEAYLEAVHQTGTMLLTNSQPASTPETKAWNCAQPLLWTPTDTAADFELASSPLALTDTDSDLLPLRSILPQSLANDVVLVLTYTVTTTSGGSVTATETATRRIQMNRLLNTSNLYIQEWAPNRKYTYHITINPMIGQILLNPTVTDWTSASAFATVE